MAINRELSQFGRLVEINDGEHIGIGTTSNVNIGFGTITVARINSLVLPTSSGSAGNVLKTDGSGNLSFEPVGAGGTWAVTDVGIHTTKSVGIGTTNATSKLTVSGNSIITGVSTFGNTTVGGATTQLIVSGNARITGILTIGTSSITLDGSNNQVNVGTGVTLHHTNGVIVGANNLHSSGLTLNSLSVGNVNSSGIITASSFVGDGGSLTNVALASTTWVVTSSGIHTLSSVGVGTQARSAHALTVSGAGSTALFVEGNARITGILSIGTGTVTIDGDNSTITATNFIGELTTNFPSGDYGDFSGGSGVDAFGQVIIDATLYDLLDTPSNTLRSEDLGVLT